MDSLPRTLVERLTKGEAGVVEEIGRQTSPPAAASDCVRALKKLRVDRELAEVQRDLNGLQEQGAARDETRTNALLVAKRALLHRRESLMEAESRS